MVYIGLRVNLSNKHPSVLITLLTPPVLFSFSTNLLLDQMVKFHLIVNLILIKMEHTKNEVTVKVANVMVNIINGIMENGRFVAKTNVELASYKEEEIAHKTCIDVTFDGNIKKIVFADSEYKDGETRTMTIDLKKLVPRLADANAKLARCRQALFNTGILAGWLIGATVTLEQTRYSQNEIVEGTDIVADKNMWTTAFKDVVLDAEIEAEVDDALAELHTARKQAFLDMMLNRK